MARKDLGSEMALEEADGFVKRLGASSRGSGAESLGGEASGVKIRREEGGEDGIGGEGVERGGGGR